MNEVIKDITLLSIGILEVLLLYLLLHFGYRYFGEESPLEEIKRWFRK